jgi:hypothetical protein
VKDLMKIFISSVGYVLSMITITVVSVASFVMVVGEIFLKFGIFYAIATLYLLVITGAATMFTISKRRDKTTKKSRGEDKYPFE